MDGPARDPRLVWVQRSYALSRLSEDTLVGIYDRVLQVRLVGEEVSEMLGTDGHVLSLPVLTGGQHAA
jgi:hypothetical protein